MFRTIIISMNILTILNAKLQELSIESDPMRQSLATCVYKISQKHFEPTETIVVGLPANTIGGHTSTFVLDQMLLRYLFIESSWTLFLQKYTRPTNKTAVNRKRNNNYIIHTRNEVEVLENLKFFKQQSWNPHAKFVIITTEHFIEPETVLKSITTVLWSFHVVDFIILIPRYSNNNIFDIYTWFPYANGNCGTEISDLVLMNSCNNGVFTDVLEMYPKKIPNKLNNCPVVIRTVLWPPFVISPRNLDRRQYSIPFTEGTEIRLMTTIAHFMGATPIFTISLKYQDWGKILDNGTATTGLFKALLDEKVDLGMASLAATKSRMNFFDYTFSYAQESITWCVPTALEEPKWMSILNILHLNTWISTIVVFCIIVLIIWRISLLYSDIESSTFQRIGSCCLYNFSATLCTSIDILPLQFHVRIIFIMWVFYSLNLCVAFQTVLMTKLTKPGYEHQMKTLNEIFDSHIEFGYISGIDIYFEDKTDISEKIMHEGRLCDQVEICLKRVANNRDFALAVPRTYLNFVSPLYYNKAQLLIYWFETNVVSYPIQIYSYKGFPLITRINDLVLRVTSSGLMKKWLMESFISYMKSRKKLVTDDDSGNKEKVLTYQHLEGAFILLAFGNLLSLLFFICEIVYFKAQHWKTLKTKPKFKFHYKE